MELEHSFTVPVPEERAWDVLLDVERVAPCMPGATLDSVNGDEIAGRIKVKVGPITMTYQGTARFTERDPAARVMTLEASGKETRGAGTASAKVRSMLEGEGGETHVVVHTSLNVTGKPAQFGRGVMTEVGGKLIGIFADNLAAMLAAESAGAAEEAEEDEEADSAGNEAGPAAATSDEALPIDVLNLPIRAWNGLRRDGIQTLGDLVRRTSDQLLAIGNIGPASVAEITSRLADRGLALAGSETPASGEDAVDSESAAGQDSSASTAKAGDAKAAARPGPAGQAEHAANTAPAAGGSETAASKAAANGGGPAKATAAPREPVSWQPQDEAIDLLGVAGLPVLKRVLPAAAGLLAVILVFLGIRRRRARRD
jgi:carbon monoxide dehydrogenase subunit G